MENANVPAFYLKMEQAQPPSGPPTPSAPKSGPNSPPQPPPGYKFIKIKYPDGRVVTAKKQLTPAELEKQQQSQPISNPPKTGHAAPEPDSAVAPNSNGTPALAPLPAAAPVATEANEGDIVGYKIPHA